MTQRDSPGPARGPKRAKPGPRPIIDRDRIIAAARDIGLEGVTMQAIATQLGVTPAALYRYVKDRDELVAAAAGTILAEFDLGLEGDHPDWQEFLRECARRIRRALLDNPHVVEHIVLGGPAGESALRLSDRAYKVLTQAGFSDEQGYRCFRLLAGVVLTSVRDQLSEVNSPDHVHPQAIEIVLALAEHDSDQLENLRRVLQIDPAMRDHDAQFEFAIDCLLAGMSQLLAGHWRSSSHTSRTELANERDVDTSTRTPLHLRSVDRGQPRS